MLYGFCMNSRELVGGMKCAKKNSRAYFAANVQFGHIAGLLAGTTMPSAQ